jgi:hypothetical protein
VTTLAQRLVAEERRAERNAEKRHLAGFNVCEKLRPTLRSFTGSAGHHALLSRALALARAEAPLLAQVQIKPDGSIAVSAEGEGRLATDAGARAGSALAEQLVGLLVNFIGEALTLRLVHDVWPKAVSTDSKLPRDKL